MPEPIIAAPKVEPQPSRKIGNLRLIWSFAKHYPMQIAAAGTALVIAASATSAIPVSFRAIIDKGFIGGGEIGRWFGYLLILIATMALATAFRFYFVSWLGERVVADLRVALLRNLVRLSPSYFEENRPAEISARLTADTTIIEQVVGTTVSMALRNLIMAVICLIVLFALSPKLAGMLVLGLPLVIGPIALFGRRLRSASRDSQDRIADVGVIHQINYSVINTPNNVR